MSESIKGTSITATTSVDQLSPLSKVGRFECIPEPVDPTVSRGQTRLVCKTYSKENDHKKNEGKVDLYTDNHSIGQTRESLPPVHLVDCKIGKVPHEKYKQMEVTQLNCTAYSHDQYKALGELQKGKKKP